MKRILTMISLLTWCLTFYASPTENKDAAKAALAQIDAQILQEQQNGNIEKESEARWQKIVTLKDFSQTKQLAEEADVQMDWFQSHNEWDNFYRTWQLKANALSAMGRLQTALQERKAAPR